jgi:hypothetical protein
MNSPIQSKLYINPVYKYFLFHYVRKNMYSHINCAGSSYSTFECEKYLHRKVLFQKLSKCIQNKIETLLECEGYMHSMWFNVNKKGSKTTLHHHNDQKSFNKLSGVYYFSKPKDSGDFIFYNPHLTTLKVKTNDIIIFDAGLMHETEISSSNKNRIVCGFNFMKF